jgi:prepilin peptidase CpaA
MPFAHVIAVGMALTACVTDLRSRRIPNVLTFGGAMAALVFHGVSAGKAGLLTSLAGWGLGLVFFLLPFALGGLGGGDIKLVAALGAWLGPTLTIWVAVHTGIAGGVLALVAAVRRGYLEQALANIRVLLAQRSMAGIGALNTTSLNAGRGLAYAPPIFVGTVLTLWLHT